MRNRLIRTAIIAAGVILAELVIHAETILALGQWCRKC